MWSVKGGWRSTDQYATTGSNLSCLAVDELCHDAPKVEAPKGKKEENRRFLLVWREFFEFYGQGRRRIIICLVFVIKGCFYFLQDLISARSAATDWPFTHGRKRLTHFFLLLYFFLLLVDELYDAFLMIRDLSKMYPPARHPVSREQKQKVSKQCRLTVARLMRNQFRYSFRATARPL